jgi:hypothetical protein
MYFTLFHCISIAIDESSRPCFQAWKCGSQLKAAMLVTVDMHNQLSLVHKYFVCIQSWLEGLMLYTEYVSLTQRGVAAMHRHFVLEDVINLTMPACLPACLEMDTLGW